MSEKAIQMLREQQSKVPQHSAQWMVAEQLMDICRREPVSAELIAQDLQNKSMTIVEAEKKIKAFADKQHVKGSNSSCVNPLEAENILREFYGLPKQGEQAKPQSAVVLNFEDFLR